MSRIVEPPPIAPPPAAPTPVGRAHAASLDEPRNFLVLVVHQVLMRVGWIFKTESIVIPAFMSTIGGGPVLLGLLPVLNRLGLSVPPLLYATRLKVTPRKKWSVVASTVAMAAPFGVLAAVWAAGAWRSADGGPAGWMPWLFLLVYGVFFGLTGVNQLGSHAVQGKLIRPTLRGRLFMTSVLIGSPLAIAAAWLLLPAWLEMPDGGFGWVFGAVALAFVLSGATLSLAAEQPDDFTEAPTRPWAKFRDAWLIVRTHADARAVGVLAALVSVNMMLFPHYQAVGRERFGIELDAMTLWVCVQNAATAAIGLVLGPMADRYGNRKALHCVVFALCLAPAAVLMLLILPAPVGRDWYWVVFAPVGFMPVTLRLLINYTLEIAPPADHPRFVSALGMCLAAPVVIGSPAVGLLFGVVGGGAVFAGGLLLLLAAGGQTFRLSEPRHRPPA